MKAVRAKTAGAVAFGAVVGTRAATSTAGVVGVVLIALTALFVVALLALRTNAYPSIGRGRLSWQFRDPPTPPPRIDSGELG